MEKPSPTYNIASRYAHNTREDTEKTDRFYDRMTMRGIAVLRDGEEDKPVWRGDHSYNSDAATYSLMHFIEPEVAREHPDWSPAQVHEDAIDRFQKRLAQDLSYERGEIAHEESVVHWRPVETTNGIELATEYGDKMVTLSELWEHTREYAAFVGNPAAYNSKEHEAQLRMQETLINGTSRGFVSVLSHPDGVRYVQIWQASDAGEITSQHVDLYAATGRDFSPEEAKDLLYHLSDFHATQTDTGNKQQEHSYAHFFLREGSVNAEDVRTIAIAQSVYSSDRLYEQEMISVSRRGTDISGGIIAESGNGMKQAGRFLAVEIEEKIRAIGNIAGKSEMKRAAKNDAGKEKRRIPVVPQGILPPDFQQTRERDAVHKTADYTGKGDLKSALAEWWISKTMLQHVSSVPAAPHAALYWFVRIAEHKTIHPSSEKQVTPRPQVLRTAVREYGAPAKPQETTKRASDVWKAFIDRIRQSVGLSAVLLRKERSTPAFHKKERGNDTKRTAPVKPENKQSPEISVIAAYYAAAVLLSRFFEQPPAPRMPKRHKETSRIHVRNGEKKKIKREEQREQAVPLGRLMFALVVWLMHSVPKEVASKQTAAGIRMPEETNQEHEPAEQTNPSERPVWILFSIIWQLAMIRESALSGSQVPAKNQQKRVRPKRKRKYASLPQHGIIFAFAS